MSNYNLMERKLAKFLARFPVIKLFFKFIYSKLSYAIAKKSFEQRSVSKPDIVKLGQFSSFFGYYDKTVENSKGLVLAMSSAVSTKKIPSAQEQCELVVFDKSLQPIKTVLVSAYNWQQGCRAHWLTDELFIYNDFDFVKKAYVSKVINSVTFNQVREFDYPVQDSFCCDYFISLNYRRLMTLRPDYGYRNLPNLDREALNDLENDGLWRVEYATGESRLLISLADACELRSLPVFQRAAHKFNHVMISPNGQQLIFTHRYLLGKRRFDRLLLADASTGVMRLLNDFGVVNHCFWADEKTILGYMRGPGNKDGYWLLDIETGEFKPCLQEKLDPYGDGHPHVHGEWFVTDTYPDKARMQHLLLCNWKTGEVKELGEFFHGFEFDGESRCDLHPRFSPDGKAVFFDSVFSGKRQLYRMELPE